MADDKELTLKTPTQGGKKKLIIMIGVLIILLGGGVGAWLMLSSKEPAKKSDSTTESTSESEKPPVAGPSTYVAMPRPFVFNVAGAERVRLVQIKVQLMTKGSKNEGLAKQHIPLIEGTLLKIFSMATAEQLMTVEGKDKLRADALGESRNVLNELTSSPVIEQVLFTGFVMQ